MNKGQTGRPPERPKLEWIVGTACGVLVLGIVGFLAFEAQFGDHRPPQLTAVIERLERGSAGTLAIVTVINEGDEAAAKVGVEATVTRAGQPPEQQDIEFDYVAAGATRSGAFVIEGEDIRMENIAVSVHGFAEP